MNRFQAIARPIIYEKVQQATKLLDEYDLDIWLTFVREISHTADPSLDLILGINVTWHSAFLISRTGYHTAIVGFFDAESVRSLDIFNKVIGYHEGMSAELRSILTNYNPRSIAINYSRHDAASDGLSHGNYLTLIEALKETPYVNRLESSEHLVAALRGRKTSAEVSRIRDAIITTERIFDQVEQFVKPGMTQWQIADFVHKKIDRLGLGYAWEKTFNPIVTCGPNSIIGHVAPGDVPLEPGHTLHIDLGIRQEGFCSDLQRMWYVLEEGESVAPPDVLDAFNVVLGAIKSGEKALKPGVQGWQVDAAARDYIVNAGYPEYKHALGHLLGRSAHDGATVLGPRWERYAGICDLPVEVGNVFTLELHVSVPNRGIMSLEEDVYVGTDGVEYLSNPQEQLRYI